MRTRILKFVSICLTVIGCTTKSDTTDQTLYFNGDIITMEGERPQYAETVVTENGKIIFAGVKADALKKYEAAKQIDLQGKTMLPAFLDGHGHMYNVGFVSLFATLLPPPDGPGADYDSIINALNEYKDTEDGKWAVNKFGWIVGFGYDDSQLREKDHPKATDLDRVSKDVPVIIIHQSGHLASISSKGLELLGWASKDTQNPEGGKLRRDDAGKPNGVLEENAFSAVLSKIYSKADEEVDRKAIQLGQDEYAKNGYLTAQEGGSTPGQAQSLISAANNGDLYIDVVSYPNMRNEGAYDLLSTMYHNHKHTYINKFRIGGVKLTLDGSPQGKTAWLTQPYLVPPQGEQSGYKGFPYMSDEEANKYVEDAFKNKWQILCHTNGDAAIDQFLNAIDLAEKKYNYDDHRSVIVHGQTIRKDQIEKAAKLKVDASLFPMHTFYWGDWHVESVLGHPRADYISPCKDALMAGLNVTSHHDAPVTFPNSMRVLDATVNRVTRGGLVLGPDQRLSPYDGLRTLTTWAAIQYFEEENKGTITPGKAADFVILDKNPVKIDPMQIHGITILESIKGGQPVYKAK